MTRNISFYWSGLNRPIRLIYLSSWGTNLGGLSWRNSVSPINFSSNATYRSLFNDSSRRRDMLAYTRHVNIVDPCQLRIRICRPRTISIAQICDVSGADSLYLCGRGSHDKAIASLGSARCKYPSHSGRSWKLSVRSYSEQFLSW